MIGSFAEEIDFSLKFIHFFYVKDSDDAGIIVMYT